MRALRYLPAFSFNALRAARQAKTAPGNLAVSLLADSNFAFWTRTLWNDQDAMRAFMLSGAHRRMMPRLLNWCDEAAVAHWTQDSPRNAIMAGGPRPHANARQTLKRESSLRGSAAV